MNKDRKKKKCPVCFKPQYINFNESRVIKLKAEIYSLKGYRNQIVLPSLYRAKREVEAKKKEIRKLDDIYQKIRTKIYPNLKLLEKKARKLKKKVSSKRSQK